MEKCQHYKWIKPPKEEARMVDLFNPIPENTDYEKCIVCGAIRYNPIPEYDKPEPAPENIDAPGREAESRIDFKSAIKKLTSRQRKIVKLLDEGYNQTEIAKKLELHRNTIVNDIVHIGQKTAII